MFTNGKAAPAGECRTRPVVEANLQQNSRNSSILQIEVPTGGLFFEVATGDGFADFLKSAHVGDALQTIYDPAAFRRGILNNRDLLALSRIHSESDLSLVRGFGQFLAVLSLESLLEISEAGRGGAR